MTELDAIHPHDSPKTQNFFELGGHSLLAARVVFQLRCDLDLEIPLRAIFQNPTIEELALCIEELLLLEIEELAEPEQGHEQEAQFA